MAVTYKCQLDCVHCSAENRRKQDKRPELGTEDMRRAIQQSVDLGVVNVTLTGGEPMIRKDIYDLINKRGIQINDIDIQDILGISIVR